MSVHRWLDCLFRGHDYRTFMYSPTYNYQECLNCKHQRRARRTW